MLQLRPISAALLAFGLLTGGASFAAENAVTPAASKPTVKQDQPLAELPYHPSLDLSSMDTSVDPCEDFYTYSCGGWKQANPIPSDQSSWSVYAKLARDNQQYLWGILAGLAKNTEGRNAAQQKIGDYFASCMDEASIEKRGLTPLQPALDLIAGMKNKASLAKVLAQLHLWTGDSGLFFGFGASQDLADSNSVIAYATGGGISLPD